MNNNEILSYVDNLINEEEGKSKKLQSQLDSLSSSSKSSEILFRSEVRFNVGISRYEHRISSKCGFDTLHQQIALKEGKDIRFGYEDKKRFRVWIRNDSDVNCCFREHFGTNNGSINFIVFKGNEVAGLTELDLSSVDNFDDNCEFVICKLALFRKDYVIFYKIKKDYTRAQTLDEIKKIFPNVNKLQMIDNDNDVITIQEDIEWNYFINECEYSFSKGVFPVLLVE